MHSRLLTIGYHLQGKTFDVITLFHKPSVPASVRVLTLLKQVSAHASETATEDQAADHTAQNKLQRTEFTLDVTEEPPTTDQAKSILEYIGVQNTGKLVEGAMSESDAMKKLREDSKKLKWPVVSLVQKIANTEG